jgi:hypothetical protein
MIKYASCPSEMPYGYLIVYPGSASCRSWSGCSLFEKSCCTVDLIARVPYSPFPSPIRFELRAPITEDPRANSIYTVQYYSASPKEI